MPSTTGFRTSRADAGAQVGTNNSETSLPRGVNLDHSDWRNGFVIGAGLEFAITPNWIAGVEYNYMDFGSATWSQFNRTAAGAIFNPTLPEKYRDDVTMQTVAVRLSYKFGGPLSQRIELSFVD